MTVLPTLALGAALPLAAMALRGWAHGRDTRDAWFGLLSVAWAALLVVELAGAGAGWLGDRALASRVAYQLAVAAATVFLLSSSGRLGRLDKALLFGFFAVQLALAMAPWLGWNAVTAPFWLWANTFGAAVLTLRLGLLLWKCPESTRWMVLLVAISGQGIILSDLLEAGDGAISVAMPHFFYYAVLTVLWLVLTGRAGGNAGHKGVTQPLALERAAQFERRRLALELHDGVGAQLASIISALDMRLPQQRATAAALQQCHAELKMLVDGMAEEASVIGHLASLRYRMQSLLHATGITLHWNIADDDLLEQVVGDPARQVLRVAQEALANVVRHSGADAVSVTCCVMKARWALMLEIADNGVGMQVEQPDQADATPAGSDRLGKGLAGMVQRARRLGGHISFEGTSTHGTRVCLVVPLAAMGVAPSRTGHLRAAA